MIFNVYRIPEYDPYNFKETFINQVWLWIEEIEVDDMDELVEHLNLQHQFLRYKVDHDVLTRYHRDTEMKKFPCPIKMFPIIKPVARPLPWCGIMI